MDKRSIDFTKAFAGLRRANPIAAELLYNGLAKYAETEFKALLQAPPDVVLVAQGRCAVVDNLLALMRDAEKNMQDLEKRG